MENLDLGYRVMVLLQHPDADIGCPLNLHGRQSFCPLEDLCREWGTETVYVHFCQLEAYGLVGRGGDPPRYVVTPEGAAFLSEIGERGGWDLVKKRVVEQPVRPIMYEVCRWVMDRAPRPS